MSPRPETMPRSMLTLMPSRSRPLRARQAAEHWATGCSGAFPHHLAVCVDADDPELPAYREQRWPTHAWLSVNDEKAGYQTAAVRHGYERYPGYRYYGYINDDHLVRTYRFDHMLAQRIDGHGGWGVAYGDDKLQGANLCTAWFASANVLDTVGWLVLPGLHHLYIDTVWRELARAAGILLYAPDVVIEHMHYLAQKAEPDEGYLRANSPAMYDHDRPIYEHYCAHQLRADMLKIKQAMP